jgi:cobalt-zinc-cadmium efflux system outer membrane protein
MLASLEPFPGHHFAPNKQGGPPQYDVTSFWPVDWLLYGKRKLWIAEAQRRVDTTAADVAETARQRVSETVAMFFSVLEAKQLVQLSHENVDNLRRVTNLTELRVKGEAAPQIDLDRAKLALAGAQRELRTAELTLENAKSQLRALMGRRDIDPTFDVAGDLAIGNPADPPGLENLVALAQTGRSDVIAAQRRIEMTAAQVAVADRDALPPLNVQAGWTYQDQNTSIGFPDAQSWNLGFAGPLPLFNRNQGNRAKVREALLQAQFELEQTRIKARSEVEQGLAAYESAYKIVTRDSPQQLEAARSVRNRIEEAYRLGDRPLFELLDAGRTFRETYRAQINAEVNYWRALHQLNAAAGQQVLP